MQFHLGFIQFNAVSVRIEDLYSIQKLRNNEMQSITIVDFAVH